MLGWLTAAALGAAGLGGVMNAITNADRPFFDAVATALSLVAQYLQARKVLDSWCLFIAGNVVFIVRYAQKGLSLTIVLYVLSSVLAAMGWLAWRKSVVGDEPR